MLGNRGMQQILGAGTLNDGSVLAELAPSRRERAGSAKRRVHLGHRVPNALAVLVHERVLLGVGLEDVAVA